MTPAREASQSLQRLIRLEVGPGKGGIAVSASKSATREGRSLRWRQIRARGVRIHLTQEAQAQDPWDGRLKRLENGEHPWQLARTRSRFRGSTGGSATTGAGSGTGSAGNAERSGREGSDSGASQVHQQWSLRMEGSRVLETLPIGLGKAIVGKESRILRRRLVRGLFGWNWL